MTNEEAIDNIKLIRFNAAITNAKSFKDALDMAIEALSQPSLPSDLDEAAVQAHIRMEESGEEMSFLNTFKAGAEWMAGQGVTVNGRITRKYVPEAAGHIEKITANFPLAIRKLIPQDTEAEVIVQIRKQ